MEPTVSRYIGIAVAIAAVCIAATVALVLVAGTLPFEWNELGSLAIMGLATAWLWSIPTLRRAPAPQRRIARWVIALQVSALVIMLAAVGLSESAFIPPPVASSLAVITLITPVLMTAVSMGLLQSIRRELMAGRI
jgi:hypothetical protein